MDNINEFIIKHGLADEVASELLEISKDFISKQQMDDTLSEKIFNINLENALKNSGALNLKATLALIDDEQVRASDIDTYIGLLKTENPYLFKPMAKPGYMPNKGVKVLDTDSMTDAEYFAYLTKNR